MKLTAYHDENGNIIAVIARPDDAPLSYMELGRPGVNMTEIDGSGLTGDLDSDQLHERLADLMKTQRIESGDSASRLVSRG
jgi:hypothetical protein